MLEIQQIQLRRLMVHEVGNKAKAEGYFAANEPYPLEDEVLKNLLLDYFLLPFKTDDLHRLTHDEDLSQHPVHQACQAMFDQRQPAVFVEQSQHLLRYLYDCSTHPRVKSGELYIAYFSDAILDGELVDAVGIFKSEVKKTYLKPKRVQGDSNSEQQINLRYEKGINPKKLDKGCLIFNTFASDGYRVMSIDTSSRSQEEAVYWREYFLQLEQVVNNSYFTQEHLLLCKTFSEENLAPETDRSEEIQFLNKSVNYFVNHDTFNAEDFADTVMAEQPDRASAFLNHYKEYRKETGSTAPEDFAISQPAVKLMKRQFKNLIKLDTGVDLRIRPEAGSLSETTDEGLPEDASVSLNNDIIEHGYDEQKKMFYYKVYFNEEQ